VAKSRTNSQKAGLTRGKAVLIGVLAVILVGVLYRQFGSLGGEDTYSSSETATYRPPVPRPAPPRSQNAAVVEADSGQETQTALLEFDESKWKSPELSAVIAYDPFALPAAFPQPPKKGDGSQLAGAVDEATAAAQAKALAEAIEELRNELEQLKQRGVHVIVNKNDEYVAMIGDRMIHVGDEINGFTVTAIDPKGVRVERKDPK
jgi:hypothetical protein